MLEIRAGVSNWQRTSLFKASNIEPRTSIRRISRRITRLKNKENLEQKYGELVLYSQHFIFFLTHEWAKWASTFTPGQVFYPSVM